MMKCRVILLLLCMMFSWSASAQDRWNITVNATTPDLVGQRLSSNFKDKLASSPRYSLSNNGNDSIFEVNLVTLDPGPSSNQSTVYALTLTLKNLDNPTTYSFFVAQYVGTCGASRVYECVDNIYSVLDQGFGPVIEALARSRTEPSAKKERVDNSYL